MASHSYPFYSCPVQELCWQFSSNQSRHWFSKTSIVSPSSPPLFFNFIPYSESFHRQERPPPNEATLYCTLPVSTSIQIYLLSNHVCYSNLELLVKVVHWNQPLILESRALETLAWLIKSGHYDSSPQDSWENRLEHSIRRFFSSV